MSNSDTKGNRIGRLDNNTLGYYRRVADTLADGFQNDEEKAIFLQNVFKQLCHEALPVSQNQTASRIVESLLHEADQEQLLSVALEFRKDWETAVTDRFASHVTQSLLLNSREQLYRDASDVTAGDHDDDGSDTMLSVFTELYRFLMGNLAVHMQHTYTSHLVRVMLEILGRVQVADKIIKSKIAMHSSDSKHGVKEKNFIGASPDNFKRYLIDMVNKIINMQKLSDHAKNNLSNPVMQTLLLVLREVDGNEAKIACKKVMEATNMFSNTDDKEVPTFLTDQIGSRLAEQVIHVSSDELLGKIITENLSGQFGKLARHPIANFVLQRLIEASRNKEQFELIFKELEDKLEDILAHNCMGVVVAMAEGALKHSTKQERFIMVLMKALHCYKPEERQLKIVTLLATLTTYEIFYKVKEDGSYSDSKDENFRLHYVVSGPESKPLMLFLHGFPEFWYSWRHQIRAFNKDYRCVAVDMRGYGESEKPKGVVNYTTDKLAEDIKEVIEALGYEKCTLVAHDWGGAVAQTFTSFYPNMVQRLILCNIPHPVAFKKYIQGNIKQLLMSWYMFFFQLPWFPEYFLGTTDYAFVEASLKRSCTEDELEAYKWSLAQPGGLMGPINYYRAAFQYKPPAVPHTPILCPTLMVWGAKDKFIAKETAGMSAKYYKDFTLNFIETAGHFVQMQAGDETNDCIREFLQRKKI